jgi:hypothetical protein
MATGFDPKDLRRLDTWAGAIAQHLRPEAPIAHTPAGLRLGRRGSLSIKASEGWFDHESGKGGKCALSLVRHLQGSTAAEAITWAQDWLDRHPGDGELNAEGAAEAAAEAGERRADFARQVLIEAIDPAGTAAESYMRTRALVPPYPPCVRYLADARTGEGAVVGVLTTATGEAVGVQLGYVDPAGRKSTVQPQRQLFFLEKSDQAAFRISVAEPAENAVACVICEGLEDALSIAQAGAAREVLGIPGIGRFSKFDLPADAEVVVFPRRRRCRQCGGEAAQRSLRSLVAGRCPGPGYGHAGRSRCQFHSATQGRRRIAATGLGGGDCRAEP